MMTEEFKWSIQDVEDLLKGTKHLIESIKHSSHNNNELLLCKPFCINNLLLEAIVEQPANDQQSSTTTTTTTTTTTWKEIIGNLRWLLNQSLMYNYDSNDDTEASLYFSKNIHPDIGGKKDDIIGRNSTLGEMIKWFPELALEQIRKNVNFATFLVENVPPANYPDVELTPDNRVLTWLSFNNRSIKKKITATLLKPFDLNTKPAELKQITPAWNNVTRYGLKFKQEEENVYKIDNVKHIFLRSRENNIVLTFTFLVGPLPKKPGPPRAVDDDDDDQLMLNVENNNNNFAAAAAGNSNEEEEEEREQFILNDYHWRTERHRPNENFRGVSIVNHHHQQQQQQQEEGVVALFDLHLHGAVSADNGGGGGKENRLVIAKNLRKSHFYTLQVKWGAEIKQRDGTVHVLPSFYAVYDNDKCLTKQSFQNTLIAEEIYPAFYLGGFVYGTKNTINVPSSSSSLLPRIIQKKSDSRMVKSKCLRKLLPQANVSKHLLQ